MLLSVFVPFFNEEEIIERNVSRILGALAQCGVEYEVFLVDDASSDNSPAVAQRLADEHGRLRYVRYENGPTRRENLAQAFSLAKGETVLFMDMDLATELSCLGDLIAGIGEGYDMVVGDRYHPSSKIKRRFFRILVSKIYNTFVSLYFGTSIRDHECGFKAFKKDVIARLVKEMGYDRTLRRGISWDTELIVRALHQGARIKTIALIWNERDKTSLHFRREMQMIPYVLSLKKKLSASRTAAGNISA